LPVTPAEVVFESANVKPENIGAEFAAVVCTVAVFELTVPICVELLYVVSSKVPVKLLTLDIAASTVERCDAVSVIVFEPLESDKLVIVNIVVEPFLITSLCV
jgi:hypothetical protein